MSKQESITEDTVRHIAQLANLTLTDEEVKKFTSQLGETLSYIAMLDEVDTSKVEPTSSVTGLHTVTQTDEPAPSLPLEEAFKNAKSKQNGFFKVKAIFE